MIEFENKGLQITGVLQCYECFVSVVVQASTVIS